MRLKFCLKENQKPNKQFYPNNNSSDDDTIKKNKTTKQLPVFPQYSSTQMTRSPLLSNISTKSGPKLCRQ